MKLSLLSAFLLLCVASGCRKVNDNWKEAVITGRDYRKCACCGGWMIHFDQAPAPYTGNDYLAQHLPADAGINEQTAFPVKVWVQVKSAAPSPCSGGFLDVVALKRRK